MSSWTREQALASSLFGWRDIRLIHNAIDVDFWTPQPKDIARDALDVPRNGKVVLFISTKIADEHKGFAYFADACRQLSDDRSEDEVHALVVGAAESEDRVDLGIPARYAGMLSDDTVVRQAYAAADVTVVPSTEEAFGKTAAESLACGTPVVSFDETGLVDVVGHKTSGYRATPFEASDIKRGIKWVLEDDDRWSALSTAGRTAVKQRFSVRSVAKEYIALYDEILGDGRAGVAFDG